MTAPLEDRFRRKINYLRVSVTDRCNLRCSYCMPEGGVDLLPHSDILSYEELLRVARVALRLGIDKIRITGGEPLVRRGILDFVGEVAALSGLRDLSLTTNGLRLAEMAPDLKAVGLSRVNVSLDTLRPERFREITRSDGLERVLAGLEAAAQAGLSPVKVNVVAMRGVNDDEIADFGAFAQKHGFEVRFIEFMPARVQGWDVDRSLTAAEILSALRRHYELVPEALAGSGPSRSFQLPVRGRIGVISPLSDHFCGRCNRLRLTAEGRLRSCLFSDRELDIRALLRSGADDAALGQALRHAVDQKPERHGILDPELATSKPAMSRVGG